MEVKFLEKKKPFCKGLFFSPTPNFHGESLSKKLRY